MLDLPALRGLARSLWTYYGRPGDIPALSQFYGRFVGAGDLCFDIGAHVGNRTRALRRLGARVVAVEPQQLFHGFLARTLPRDRITLVRAAVGAEVGTVTLAVSRRHPTVSTAAAEWRQRMATTDGFRAVDWDRTEAVDCTTLDALIEGHGLPRFVKIDVEGFEATILVGLGRPVPVVCFEYLADAVDLVRPCLDRLTALGPYRFNVVPGEDTAFALPDWVEADALMAAVPRIAADGRHGDVYARLSE